MNCIICAKRIRKKSEAWVASSTHTDIEIQLRCPHCRGVQYTFVPRLRFARLDFAEALHKANRKRSKKEAA